MTRATDTGRGPYVLDLEQLRTALDGVVDLAVARFGPTVDLDELVEMVARPDEQVLSHSSEHLVALLGLVAFLDPPRGPRLRPAGRTSPLPDPVIDPSGR